MDPILAQLQELLAQYLAQGEDTPVAPEAQQLMAAIEAAGGGEQGAPPDAGGAPPDMGMGMPPEGGGMPPGGDMPPEDDPMASMMPATPPGSFAEASSMATDDLKKRKSKAPY